MSKDKAAFSKIVLSCVVLSDGTDKSHHVKVRGKELFLPRTYAVLHHSKRKIAVDRWLADREGIAQ